MIAECRVRKHHEQMGKSTHSTELDDFFKTFLESLNIEYNRPTHMTADLKIGGKTARTLRDTGTVGVNLMSLNWAQSNRIKTKKIDNPVDIRMATKDSKAMANHSAKEDIEIGNVKRISCNFLLLPISSYDVILGMPFMTKANVILRPGSGNATFGDSNMAIKCASLGELTAAAAIKIIPATTELLDVKTSKLELLDTIRRMAKAAIDILNDSELEEAHPHAEELLIMAAQIFNQQLPNFQKEFPTVYVTACQGLGLTGVRVDRG